MSSSAGRSVFESDADDSSSSSLGMGESLRGDARLFPAGFGVDGFDLLLPKTLARSGMSLSIGLNIHDRKRSNGL